MRTFRDFEIQRLQKIVDDATKPDEELRKIKAHHHKLVIKYTLCNLFLIIVKSGQHHVDNWLLIPKSRNCAYINITMEKEYLAQIQGLIKPKGDFSNMYIIEVCESLQGPYQIWVDFTSLVTSRTIPEERLMHSSVPIRVAKVFLSPFILLFKLFYNPL